MTWLWALSLALCLYGCMGKIFDKCELANLLETKHEMGRDQVNNWVCIAQYESTFNTTAINHYNWDGSKDYGLFQLNNKYWCDSGYGKNVCRLPCTDLLDDDLTDDLKCIRRIIKDTERWKGKGTGLQAWVAYVKKCENRDLVSYMSECWDVEQSNGTDVDNIINTIGNTLSVISDAVSIVSPTPSARIPVIRSRFTPLPFLFNNPRVWVPSSTYSYTPSLPTLPLVPSSTKLMTLMPTTSILTLMPPKRLALTRTGLRTSSAPQPLQGTTPADTILIQPKMVTLTRTGLRSSSAPQPLQGTTPADTILIQPKMVTLTRTGLRTSSAPQPLQGTTPADTILIRPKMMAFQVPSVRYQRFSD